MTEVVTSVCMASETRHERHKRYCGFLAILSPRSLIPGEASRASRQIVRRSSNPMERFTYHETEATCHSHVCVSHLLTTQLSCSQIPDRMHDRITVSGCLGLQSFRIICNTAMIIQVILMQVL